MNKALIIGGTRGIGLALSLQLIEQGWFVVSTGRAEFDLGNPDSYWEWTRNCTHEFDLVVFSAGTLDPEAWNKKKWSDYLYSYRVHAIGPVWFLANFERLMHSDAHIVFISSSGAENSGIIDLGYSMSKAALNKAYKALNEHTDYDIRLFVFDLVDTDMMARLPKDTLEGREVISAEQAAREIMKCLET